MNNNAFKKYVVLGILFVFPIVIYLFFASGINNFAKLPILTKNLPEINSWKTLRGDPVQFQDRITVIGFWGNDLESKKSDAFNLNQKIYKRFYEFKDFHDRSITANNGWKIGLGRGLDIFNRSDGRFNIANFDQTKRSCKDCEITYLRVE